MQDAKQLQRRQIKKYLIRGHMHWKEDIIELKWQQKAAWKIITNVKQRQAVFRRGAHYLIQSMSEAFQMPNSYVTDFSHKPCYTSYMP